MIKIILMTSLLFIESSCLVRSIETQNIDDLLAVAVYFRHGDRTPEKSFPTDEFFKLENFPMGLGQLTNKGINRHYQLGQWFRNRYSTFLPQPYSPSDILVRSTDIDRTLMSAAANLAGLYPPEGDLVWNRNLLWRPIPIHTIVKSDDAILAMKKACPRLEKLYEESKQSEFYQKVNEEYADFFEYVSNNSGLNVTDIDNIKLIRSVFYCYENFNSSYIPSWAHTLNQTVLDYLSGLAYARHSTTDEMKRLRSGPFMDYLISYFTNVSSSEPETPKFMMFSSHDTELVSVLDAMGVYDFYPPSFAASIIWEMKRDAQGSYYLNLFYRKDEDLVLPLVVPGCTADCQFDQFKTLLESVSVDQGTWEEECYR